MKRRTFFLSGNEPTHSCVRFGKFVGALSFPGGGGVVGSRRATRIKQVLVQGLVSWLTEDIEGEQSMKKVLLKRCKQPPHHLQTQSLRLLQVKQIRLNRFVSAFSGEEKCTFMHQKP